MTDASEVLNLTHVDRTLAREVTPGRWEKILSCIQCGTCTASCPAAHAMDLSPRRMWRMVQLGMTEEVLRSKSIWFCSLCYNCHVRCPRGIPLTETIVRLKELAIERGIVSSPRSGAFYRTFAEVIRRYGRMREVELMARYFLASSPLGALGFARLGLTMLVRGKIGLELPRLGGGGRLDRLFARVAELEAEQ
ncbi:MAG: 4Fe-4S dicluster domain-containing protein [Anaerolineae bacterium]|nr:4Fe-4S dicluster domain-containing protein [Anaerolineae bacterium]